MSAKTINAVRREIASMQDIDEFELGILSRVTGVMRIEKVVRDDVIKSLPYLQAKNASLCDIYIRPDRKSNHAYLLLDDLAKSKIELMKEEGIQPCLILETSPDNYQSLIFLPEGMPAKARKHYERVLQQQYQSDPGSCDGQHFFRLAGFINRKPKYDALNPFWVLCRSSKPGATIASDAWERLKEQTNVDTHIQTISKHKIPATNYLVEAEESVTTNSESVSEWLRDEVARQMMQVSDDQSRAEWRACGVLLRDGVSRKELVIALVDISSFRKGKAAAQYATHTINKLINS